MKKTSVIFIATFVMPLLIFPILSQAEKSEGMSDGDYRFLTSIEGMRQAIISALRPCGKGSLESSARAGKYLETICDRYQTELSGHSDISYEMDEIRLAAILMLRNFEKAGKYLESGARYNNEGDLKISVDYIHKGSEHLGELKMLLVKYNITQP